MRRALLLALGLTLASHYLTAQGLKDGLVFYAPFDGNAVNLVGWVKPVNTGAVMTENKFGERDKAIRFDGENDILDYGNILDLGTTNFTISVWIKADDFTQGDRYGQGAKILNKGLHETKTNGYRGFGIRAVNFADSGNNFRFMTADGRAEDRTPIVQFTDRYGLLAQEWYHLVAIRSGAATQLYLNGELVITGVVAKPADLSIDQPFSVGGSLSSEAGIDASAFFAGTLDELRIYNRRLSEHDIELLHQQFVNVGPSDQIRTERPKQQIQLSVFPNPATRILKLDFEEEADRRIEIVDGAGRNMFYGRFPDQRAEVNVSGLPPGTYFIRIAEGDRVAVRKFVKQGAVLP